MFVLNTFRELDYVPMIGDVIQTRTSDFQKASYRIKSWRNENYTRLDFVVKERTFNLALSEWNLICEPSSKSLVYLLRTLNTKKK